MDQETWDQSRRRSPVEELGLDQADSREERGWRLRRPGDLQDSDR